MVIAFYELLPGRARPEKHLLNAHPHLEAPLPAIGDLVRFEGANENEVPGWFRVRSRVFSHAQIPGVEPTLAITVVVERIEDEEELRRAGVK
jgi:hypothetical protein